MEFNSGLLAGMSREEAKQKYPPVDNLPNEKAVYVQKRNKMILWQS